MSSDGSVLPEQAASDDSTPLDLRKVFSHPAGLRTARYIVGHFIQASQSQNLQTAGDNFSSVSPTLFDSSPEVANLLKEILAFSESDNTVTGSVGNGAATSSLYGNRGGTMAGAASSLSSHFERSRPQQSLTMPPFNAQTSIANSSANYYTSNRPNASYSSHQRMQLPPVQTMSGMEVSSSSKPSGSSFHGTESPYHVESPSGRSSTNTPQPMSRQSSGRHTQMSNLPNPENEPLRLDQAASFAAQFQTSQGSNNSQTKMVNGGYFTSVQAMSSSRNQPYNSTSSNFQSRLPNNIKNFLPVNKAPNNNSKSEPVAVERAIAIGNRPSQGVSQTSTHISTSHAAHSPVLISPHPGVDHPLFKAQSTNTAMEPKVGKKRKPKADGVPRVKRQKTDKPAGKVKRVPKEKEVKPIPACQKLSDDLWMRILEFSPPHFLKKVRLWNRAFKEMVDGYDSLFVNQRMENFGVNMPIAKTMGLTERQYTDLLGGKGCLEPGCTDKKASRTHWSWAKRWCTKCWQNKIEREDRILKARQHDFPQRQILTKLLECIPIGMHDSFMKAHDYIENLEARPSTAPRIYKYYIKSEVDKIIEEYQAFKLLPFKDDPNKSAAENASARTEHQQKEAEAAQQQSDFLDERKAKNDEHMQRVLKIEGAIRKKRQEDAQPYNKNREGRRELFLKRASEEIPDIPATFITETKAFKAATRIFRDAGTERGWQTLKPKIEKEWEDSAEKRRLERGEGAENDDDIATIRGDKSQDTQPSTNLPSREASQPYNSQQNQLPGIGPQRYDQVDMQAFMADRASSMMSSSGMFGPFYSNYGANNSYGRTAGSSLHANMFSTASLGNSFLDGSTQFQSSNINHNTIHMPTDLAPLYQSNTYMNFPHSSTNNNNFYGTGSANTQPGERKITVNSLLADPAPGGYDAYQ
ncbi:hypothetical protein ONS95_002312 [Cadophora gregata]|uniref:uncharacterized protein n=1 Tax=Cadophora gregata TaxID=51156 RepID=UPI0026DBC545|nr:uncharacterized protein ONS95_002312 [Cadophora gregata]KAK0109631.1 hypothetical protein ONS95_002312 [Cadophora gregata]